MFSILIKDSNNSSLYRFLTVNKDVMLEGTKQTIDPDTGETIIEDILVPTGEVETVRFETESRQELEEKCIELLEKYNKNQFIPINTEPFEMDLLWENEKVITEENEGNSGE